jgi:gas vesicle protein
MKFRTGVIIGFAAGYVLGAKAGRERYDQIRRAAKVVADNPPIRRVIDDSKELADAGTARAREAVSDQLHQASDAIRERAAG